MGGLLSGRSSRGERQAALREHRLILDARDLVKRGVIRRGSRRGGTLESILAPVASNFHLRMASGPYLVHCGDTLPLGQQHEFSRPMKLGIVWLDFVVQRSDQACQEIGLFAALTRLDVVFWGFECPGCRRYARKLFLPKGRREFRCRRCHRLRYRSQDKLNRWARVRHELRLAGSKTFIIRLAGDCYAHRPLCLHDKAFQ